MAVKHDFVSAIADGADTTLVRPSNWNADHTLENNTVTDAHLRDSGALSVIGRSANSTGDPADISATAATGAVLRESGSALGFGTIATAGIANDAVTYAKIQNVSATDRLLGRDTAAAGDIEELTAGGGVEFTGSGGIQTSAFTGDVTKAAGGTALTANLTNLTAIDLALDDHGIVTDTSDSNASRKALLNRLGGLLARGICGFRLTTETGVGVSTSDRSAQGTIYATPYGPDAGLITLYDGTRWILYDVTERSLALTVTSGKNYDVFMYDNAGTLTLELSAAWTNDTTRADALTTQNNIYVKSGATTRRWLGTIRASGSNVTEDSGAIGTSDPKRFVYNGFNKEPREIITSNVTDHAYTTAAYREWNNGTGSERVSFVNGETGARVMVGIGGRVRGGGQLAWGLDSTTVASASVAAYNAGSSDIDTSTPTESIAPGLGYHQIVPIEQGAASGNFVYYSIIVTIWN